jgi:sugar phosphate permease
MNSDPAPDRSRWELITLGCMFTGYMAFIFSRTALPVASPEMLKDVSLGLDEASYGDIAAWGTAGMITGKLLTGVIADWIGGPRVFLVALSASALLTFAFGWGSSETVFASLNFVMLFAVAASWPAMAGIIRVWFPPTKYGRVWGMISTSSRLSASISLVFLGTLLTLFSWQNIFRIAGIIALCVAAFIAFYLKARPEDAGLPSLSDEREANPEAGTLHPLDDKNPAEALRAFAGSRRFWLICMSIMCTTILMEFILFLPLYLSSFEGVSSAQASTGSAAFPIGCVIALIAGGFIYDGVSRKGRIGLLGGMLGGTCVCIGALWGLNALPVVPLAVKFPLAIVILFFYGLTLAPAYYLPMSIFSNEFGGRHCGFLVGLIDMAGYCASMLYLIAGGRMVVNWGWQSMIQLFLVVGVVATVVTIWFAFEDYRRFSPTDGKVGVGV